MMKKEFKKLYKYYKKLLRQISKLELREGCGCMNYFIVYLMYLRDSFILSCPDCDFDNDPLIKTIGSAIETYQLSQSCIEEYFEINAQGMLIPKDKSMPYAEVAKQHQKRRLELLSIFWQIVATCSEDWFNAINI